MEQGYAVRRRRCAKPSAVSASASHGSSVLACPPLAIAQPPVESAVGGGLSGTHGVTTEATAAGEAFCARGDAVKQA